MEESPARCPSIRAASRVENRRGGAARVERRRRSAWLRPGGRERNARCGRRRGRRARRRGRTGRRHRRSSSTVPVLGGRRSGKSQSSNGSEHGERGGVRWRDGSYQRWRWRGRRARRRESSRCRHGSSASKGATWGRRRMRRCPGTVSHPAGGRLRIGA